MQLIQAVETGYKVVFDDDRSYILHKKTKKIIHMREERLARSVVTWSGRN